ncbi:MarR family transcriptional regulator [Halovenus sp. WSH3]|uniref:MarR family transcriptional regulator n=1 Tax=Halovenus carboxidivorans TaxID=2692199 RepID=A0A6B0T7L0_9EURY|nr:winged helix-turn-helix domain-containing protein [Halovenus carboxidivorans]MXR52196.1 MarR family transcriptional regulator [Halovenus carboxidivorans]
MSDDLEDVSSNEFRELVDQNGLCKLFANRTRARILVTLFYADRFLSVKEIANAAEVNQTAVQQATDQLETFDFLEKQDYETEQAEYRIDRSDSLVQEIETVAEMATERFYAE